MSHDLVRSILRQLTRGKGQGPGSSTTQRGSSDRSISCSPDRSRRFSPDKRESRVRVHISKRKMVSLPTRQLISRHWPGSVGVPWPFYLGCSDNAINSLRLQIIVHRAKVRSFFGQFSPSIRLIFCLKVIGQFRTRQLTARVIVSRIARRTRCRLLISLIRSLRASRIQYCANEVNFHFWLSFFAHVNSHNVKSSRAQRCRIEYFPQTETKTY